MNSIEKYWKDFAQINNLPSTLPEAWMFGDGSESMGDELGALVVNGIKTGTCSAECVYELEGEELQKVGQYDIILDGRENPLAIIQYTDIEVLPMNEVSEAFAFSEGEGDRSYEYWYREHEKFFTWELGLYDLPFTPDMLVVCQTFKVVDIYGNKQNS